MFLIVDMRQQICEVKKNNCWYLEPNYSHRQIVSYKGIFSAQLSLCRLCILLSSPVIFVRTEYRFLMTVLQNALDLMLCLVTFLQVENAQHLIVSAVVTPLCYRTPKLWLRTDHSASLPLSHLLVFSIFGNRYYIPNFCDINLLGFHRSDIIWYVSFVPGFFQLTCCPLVTSVF